MPNSSARALFFGEMLRGQARLPWFFADLSTTLGWDQPLLCLSYTTPGTSTPHGGTAASPGCPAGLEAHPAPYIYPLRTSPRFLGCRGGSLDPSSFLPLPTTPGPARRPWRPSPEGGRQRGGRRAAGPEHAAGAAGTRGASCPAPGGSVQPPRPRGGPGPAPPPCWGRAKGSSGDGLAGALLLSRRGGPRHVAALASSPARPAWLSAGIHLT